LDGAAKVAQLCFAAQSEQRVHALDVAVYDAKGVQVIDGGRHLSNARQALARKQLFIAEFLEDGASTNPLHEDKWIVRLQANTENCDAAGVAHPALHLHLRHEVAQVALRESNLRFRLLQRERGAVPVHTRHKRKTALALGRGCIGSDVGPLQVQAQPARHFLGDGTGYEGGGGHGKTVGVVRISGLSNDAWL
jgi:hypothetical protein